MGKPQNSLSMSPCALKFALACSDPFNPSANGCCIPDSLTYTQKTKAFTRFSAFVGESGVGFVVVTPSLANNVPSMYFTNAAFNGTTSSILSANNVLISGISKADVPTPYPASQFLGVNPTLMGRIVAVGVKISYVGTTLDQSGLYFCKHDPEHDSVINQSTAQLGSSLNTEVSPITRRPCTLNIFPTTTNEFRLTASRVSDVYDNGTDSDSGRVYPFSPTNIMNSFQDTINGVAVGAPVGIIAFTGVPGSTIHIEYVAHMEFTGSQITGLATPNVADLQGATNVINAARDIVMMKQANPQKSSWDLMRIALSRLWKASAPILVPMAENAITAALAMA